MRNPEEPGLLLLDDGRVIVSLDELGAALLGGEQWDLVGRRADEFIPGVGRPLFPLAWRGFLLRGHASGEYAAHRPDGSTRHLAYAGFANRPARGLHYFVLQPLPDALDARALVPRQRGDWLQFGPDLPADLVERLEREADRSEPRLPVTKDARRAIFASSFEDPGAALEALAEVRELGCQTGVAPAAGPAGERPRTLLAGRAPYLLLGQALDAIRRHGGRIMVHVDERRA